MKIPNKDELQQTAFNHLSDIYFKDFINLYKKCTANLLCKLQIFFFSDDTTLASDNLLHFRKNFLERILKQIVTIDDKIKDEKL